VHCSGCRVDNTVVLVVSCFGSSTHCSIVPSSDFSFYLIEFHYPVQCGSDIVATPTQGIEPPPAPILQ
jgi:hypothetical protein